MDETVGVEVKQEQDPQKIFPELDSLEISPEIKTDFDDIVKSEDQYYMNYDEDWGNNLPSESGLFLKAENASLGATEEDSINKIDIDEHEFPTEVILECKGDYESTLKQWVKDEQRLERKENALAEEILIDQKLDLPEISSKAVAQLNTEIDLCNFVVKSEDQFHKNCDENSSDNLQSENKLVSKDCPSVEAIQSSDFLESEGDSDVNKSDYDQQDASRQAFFQENVELQAEVFKLKQVEKKDDRNNTSVSKEKRHECLYCDYETQNICHLKVHVSAIHKRGNAKVHCCQQCTYKTLHAYNLCRHIKVHEANKCLSCYKAFNKKAHLDSHLLTNHENLQHLITHKIHYCKFCTYRTIYSKNLICHVAHNHNRGGAEKFQCYKCDYFALQKSNLQKHLLVHADTKPYLCIVCRKEFSRKLSLDSHILCKHKGNADMLKNITSKIQQCTFCTYETVKGHDLQKHIKRKHKQTSI